MDKVKRRDFLKLISAAIPASIALSYPTEAVELPTKPSSAAKEKITPINEPEIRVEKGEAADQSLSQYNLEIVNYWPDYCHCRFHSQECNYKGNDVFCFKGFEDCKAKGNEARFGGFPPIRN